MATGRSQGLRIRRSEAMEHHNCLSWCEKHLERIGVDLVEKSWKDGLVNNPAAKLPYPKSNRSLHRDHQGTGANNNNEDNEPTSGPRCDLM
jgi:hypothetical protein